MNLSAWWNAPWWSSAGTIVSFVVLVVTVIFFIVSQSTARRNRREDRANRRQERTEDRASREAAERERRISNVVEGYVRLATGHPIQDGGIHALIISGVRELRDDGEIRDAMQLIVARTGAHPLGADGLRLNPGCLKAFVHEVGIDGPNTLGYQEALEKFSVQS